LTLGKANWDLLVRRVERAEQEALAYGDEQVWTYLLACAYAAAPDGPSMLAGTLTGEPFAADSVWLEVLPTLTREREGYTNIDLALGDLRLRGGTEGGIELAHTDSSAVVFSEFKWFSDISTNVSHDQHRNQLARVIETALMFRSASGVFADKVHVTLVTPQVFKTRRAPSRLYRYKWNEYTRDDHAGLVADLEECCLSPTTGLPTALTRLPALRLNWCTYEELAFGVPASPLRNSLARFYSVCAGPHLSAWPSSEAHVAQG
jgi:hypothetical protein